MSAIFPRITTDQAAQILKVIHFDILDQPGDPLAAVRDDDCYYLTPWTNPQNGLTGIVVENSATGFMTDLWTLPFEIRGPLSLSCVDSIRARFHVFRQYSDVVIGDYFSSRGDLWQRVPAQLVSGRRVNAARISFTRNEVMHVTFLADFDPWEAIVLPTQLYAPETYVRDIRTPGRVGQVLALMATFVESDERIYKVDWSDGSGRKDISDKFLASIPESSASHVIVTTAFANRLPFSMDRATPD